MNTEVIRECHTATAELKAIFSKVFSVTDEVEVQNVVKTTKTRLDFVAPVEKESNLNIC